MSFERDSPGAGEGSGTGEVPPGSGSRFKPLSDRQVFLRIRGPLEQPRISRPKELDPSLLSLGL